MCRHTGDGSSQGLAMSRAANDSSICSEFSDRRTADNPNVTGERFWLSEAVLIIGWQIINVR
jgi:hypothetical protein